MPVSRGPKLCLGHYGKDKNKTKVTSSAAKLFLGGPPAFVIRCHISSNPQLLVKLSKKHSRHGLVRKTGVGEPRLIRKSARKWDCQMKASRNGRMTPRLNIISIMLLPTRWSRMAHRWWRRASCKRPNWNSGRPLRGAGSITRCVGC